MLSMCDLLLSLSNYCSCRRVFRCGTMSCIKLYGRFLDETFPGKSFSWKSFKIAIGIGLLQCNKSLVFLTFRKYIRRFVFGVCSLLLILINVSFLFFFQKIVKIYSDYSSTFCNKTSFNPGRTTGECVYLATLV